MSFTELPNALIETILAYLIDDPLAVCRLESTCQLLAGIVKESKCWDTLHRQRWTVSSTTNDKSKTYYTKIDYKRRHIIDQKTKATINTLVRKTTEEPDVLASVVEIMRFGTDAMDICWKTGQEQKECDHGRNEEEDNNILETNNQQERPRTHAVVARALLRSLHCSAIFEDIKQLCSSNTIMEEEEPGKELEEYVILSSRTFFDLKNGPVDTTSDWIRQQLDEIASQVKTKFPSDPERLTTQDKIQAVNSVFFDELGFGGIPPEGNYYDFRNSLLHYALQERIGIPMTLAILYKCISRRVGLHVDIIGLPGMYCRFIIDDQIMSLPIFIVRL